jgi:hypothetical protein
MDADDLSKAHEDFIVAGYDSVTTKSHFFYIVGTGHRAHIEPVHAGQIANDLVTAGLAELAATKDRIQLNDKGREVARKIREKRDKAEVRKGRGWDVFLLVAGAVIGAILTLATAYLIKRLGWN